MDPKGENKFKIYSTNNRYSRCLKNDLIKSNIGITLQLYSFKYTGILYILKEFFDFLH